MIIDFHTHIFPDAIEKKAIASMSAKSSLIPYSEATADGLLSSMKESGVDYSVILPVATRASQFSSINEFAVHINETKGQKKGEPCLISFGGIHPDSGDYRAELRAIKDMGLIGIKLHPDYQDTMFDDIRYMRIIDYASELGLIISVHAGIDVGYPDHIHCTVDAAKRVIQEVRPEKLVLAHYGGFGMWDEVEEKLVGENVYLDTAFTLHKITEEQFLRILRNHGSDKILFATDSPWGGQKESLQKLNDWNLTQAERENLLYRNASLLLNV